MGESPSPRGESRTALRPRAIELPEDDTGAEVRAAIGALLENAPAVGEVLTRWIAPAPPKDRKKRNRAPNLPMPSDYIIADLGLAGWLQAQLTLAGVRSAPDPDPRRAEMQEAQRAAAELAAEHLRAFIEAVHGNVPWVRLLELAIDLGRVVERSDAAEYGRAGIGSIRKQQDASRSTAESKFGTRARFNTVLERHWAEAERETGAAERWEKLRALIDGELGAGSVHSIEALKKRASGERLRFSRIRKLAS